MVLGIEKILINKKFYEIENDINALKYAKSDDITTQFIINYHPIDKYWEVSFPLTDIFNYKTKFTDYNKMINYSLQRISEM
jgi:hypothetical protein